MSSKPNMDFDERDGDRDDRADETSAPPGDLDAIIAAVLDHARVWVDDARDEGRAILLELERQVRDGAAEIVRGEHDRAARRQRAVEGLLNARRDAWLVRGRREVNAAIRDALSAAFRIAIEALR